MAARLAPQMPPLRAVKAVGEPRARGRKIIALRPLKPRPAATEAPPRLERVACG